MLCHLSSLLARLSSHYGRDSLAAPVCGAGQSRARGSGVPAGAVETIFVCVAVVFHQHCRRTPHQSAERESLTALRPSGDLYAASIDWSKEAALVLIRQTYRLQRLEIRDGCGSHSVIELLCVTSSQLHNVVAL